MNPHEGVLFNWFEAGSEGRVWALKEDGEHAEDDFYGINFIEEGDYLTVYDDDGKIIFYGEIICDHRIGWTSYYWAKWWKWAFWQVCFRLLWDMILFFYYHKKIIIHSPYDFFGQPAALGYWIHWTQKGWKPDDWARLFIGREGEKHFRAELCKKKEEEEEE